MPDRYNKDPSSLLDYSWDWTPWLTQVGDTISSVTVSVSEGLTAVDEPVVDDGVVTQRVSGGTAGVVSTVVCQITTVSGLIDERSIYLTIMQR